MRFCICLLLVMVPLCAAERPSAAKSGEVKKANRAQARPPAAGVPAGAVETSPGSWHYTDAQGKGWVYRKTPFGIARVEEKPATPDAKTAQLEKAALNSIQATEDGDMVRFERKGPFGVYKWSKPKNDLNEMEGKAWESSRKKTAAPAGGKQE